jgi:hypothetical protein
MGKQSLNILWEIQAQERVFTGSRAGTKRMIDTIEAKASDDNMESSRWNYSTI